MNVRVVLFAKPRELVGQPNIDLALPAGAAAADAALVVFQGIVRSHSRGKQVRALVYEAYGSMAIKQMEHIADEARQRWPILDLAIVHRTGTLHVGEVSVVIAVAGSHRGEAF